MIAKRRVLLPQRHRWSGLASGAIGALLLAFASGATLCALWLALLPAALRRRRRQA